MACSKSIWTIPKYGTTWFYGNDKPMAAMIKHAGENGKTFFVSMDENYTDKSGVRKTGKCYASYKNIHVFNEYYKKIGHPVSMFELYTDNMPVALCGDCEGPLDKYHCFELVRNRVMDALNSVFDKLKLETICDDDLIWLTACSREKNKMSYHFKCPRYHFSSAVVHARFYALIEAHLSSESPDLSFYLERNQKGSLAKKCFIDGTVYSSAQNMRCYDSCKIDKNTGEYVRPFKMVDPDIDPECSFMTYISEGSIDISSRVPATSSVKKRDTSVLTNPSVLQKLVDDYGISDAEVGDIVFSNAAGRAIAIKKNGKTRLCPWSQRETGNNAYLWVSDKKIAYRCHEESCKYETTKNEFLLWEDKSLESSQIENYVLAGGEKDLKEILVTKIGDRVKLGLSKNLYVYDVARKLWTVVNHKNNEMGIIKEIAMNELLAIYDEYISDYQSQIHELTLSQVNLADGDEKENIMTDIDMKDEFLQKMKKIKCLLKSNGFIKNILDLAICKLLDHEIDDKMNKSPHELPLKNKMIVDLRTGNTRMRVMTDLFTHECPVSYIPNLNNYEHIKLFINNITDNDAEYTDYMQELLGYILTGYISERCFFILQGDGFNGKSSLFECLVAKILGKFYATVSADAFANKTESKGQGRATPELMALQYARAAVFSEGDKQSELNDKRIKNLTGGDKISARALYGDQIEFKTQAKILMITNPKPLMNVQDIAMVDRTQFVPFRVRFERGNIESKKFVDNICDLWIDECFSWMVDGAMKWFKKEKLTPAKICREQLDEYLKELDTVQLWIDSECEIGDDYVIRPTDAFTDYNIYCKVTDNKAMLNSKDFGMVMKKRFEHKKKSIHGVQAMYYIGIKSEKYRY